MTIGDWVFISIIALNAFSGLRKGFVRLIVESIGILVGIKLSLDFYDIPEVFLSQWVHPPKPILAVIGFVLIFMAVISLFTILSQTLSKIVSFTGLGLFNRVAGCAVGTLKGAIIVLAIITPFFMFNISIIDQSIIATTVKPYIQTLTSPTK